MIFKPNPIRLITICISFFTFFSFSPDAHAAMPSASQKAVVQQALSSGQISQTQMDQATKMLETGQITQEQIQQVLQMLQTGQLTPEQIQQGMQMLQTGQVSQEKLDELMQKNKKGTLTRDEIEAGKRMLEEKATEGDVNAYEPEDEFDLGYEREIELDLGPEIFGHKLFMRSPSTFAPLTNIPVSNDYIIGPGDEINVMLWGRIDATYTMVVDEEGVIQLPQIGPLSVAGQTFAELKQFIRQKAEAITGVNAYVYMGELRSIQIFVLGEVKAPGVYTISSLATVTNALLASGGPTRLGSLRKVELKRNNQRVSKLDFYDFLMKGDTSADMRLMPGDVIFVPQAGPMVDVTGNVKRPMIYELKDTLTLQNAIALAGGLDPRAYNQRIQIERAEKNKDQIVVDILQEELDKGKAIPIQDGDIVRVSAIIADSVNAVYLYGNVLRPGEYAYSDNLKVLDILPSIDDLQMDTYFPYALIKRHQRDKMDAELIPFNLGHLLLNHDMSQNMLLLPLDEVYVFNKNEFKDPAYAEIEGRVRKPGKYDIDRMTIRDLIFKAGRLERDAYMPQGHLYRTDPVTKAVTILSFNVEQAMANDPLQNIMLKDLDKVIIHSIFDYNEKYTVTISGSVNNPGSYPFAENMTAKDLVEVAGSTKDNAYLDEAELVRYHIVDGKTLETTIIKFNLSLAMAGDSENNPKLYPLDVVSIKQVPEWQERKKSVKITGEVRFPGTYQIRKDERLVDLLNRAGGYTEFAYLRGAVFTRESVRKTQQQRIDEMVKMMEAELFRMSSREVKSALSIEDVQAQTQFIDSQKTVLEKLKNSRASGRVTLKLSPLDDFSTSRFDMTLEDGDTLHIPSTPSTVNVVGAVYNANAHVYDSKYAELKYYLARSGGPTKNAEEDEIYIIRADGTVISKQGGGLLGVSWDENQNRWGFWNKFENTELYPGDTILVPEKIIKPDFMKSVKDVTQILYQIAVTAGITITQVF